MSRIYATGTAAVANGATTVTITGGVLTDLNCPADADVVIEGVANFVASRTDTTHFELVSPHEGDGGSGLAYSIRSITAAEIATATLNARLVSVIEGLESDPVVALSDLPSLTTALRPIIVKSDGQGIDTRPLKTTLIGSFTQSNGSLEATVSWDVPDNFRQWNGGAWNGDADIATKLGSAFEKPDGTKVQTLQQAAVAYARKHPDEMVYYVNISHGGTGVRAAVGVEFDFDDGLAGDPGAGGIGFDSASPGSITTIRFSETDANGFRRFLATDALSTSTFYPCRLEVIGDETGTFIEIIVSLDPVDGGTWRSQAGVTVTESANWPPAGGAHLRVWPGQPRMDIVLEDNVEAAFTALGLVGSDRKFDTFIIWPTEGDINYPEAYEGRDYDKLMELLSSYVDEATTFIHTLPYPYATGISVVRQKWWDAIRRKVAEYPTGRKLVSLSQTGAAYWGSANNVHVLDDGMIPIGRLIEEAASYGGEPPFALSAGAYTPVPTNIVNIDAITAYEGSYKRVGSSVDGGGLITIDPTTAGGTTTTLWMSPPVASDFSLGIDASGEGVALGLNNQTAYINADPTTNELKMSLAANYSTPISVYYHFDYKIIES